MGDPLITYFENHPFISEIDYKNPYHYIYLRELLGVIQKKDLLDILEKLFNTKTKKKSREYLLKNFESELLNVCEAYRSSIKLIGICGVHLDSLGSIVKLQLLLKTFETQILKVNMILSISWENINIQEILTDLKRYKNLTIELHKDPVKLTTFEHYAFVVSKYHLTHKDHHVIFTDTNGMWSNKRSMAHMLSIIFCKMMQMRYDFIVYPYVFDNHINKIQGYGEYTSYTIKLGLLKRFLDVIDVRILKSDFCGKYLIKYLNNVICWFGMKVPLVDYTYRLIIDNNSDNISIQDLVTIYHSTTNMTPIEFLSSYLKNLSVEKRNDMLIKFLGEYKKPQYEFLMNSPIYEPSVYF